MKKSIVVLITFFTLNIFSSILHAQDKKMNMADFEKRKWEYVKEKAGLTQQEAQQYFPLSNELTLKKFELNRKPRVKVEQMRENNRNMSDNEYRQILDTNVEIKMKEAELDKEYSEKFSKVLSAEKLFRAQQAEKTFIQNEVNKFRENKTRNEKPRRTYNRNGKNTNKEKNK